MLLKESCKEYLLKEHKTEEIIADYHSSLYASVILTTIRWLFYNDGYSVKNIIEDLKSVFKGIL